MISIVNRCCRVGPRGHIGSSGCLNTPVNNNACGPNRPQRLAVTVAKSRPDEKKNGVGGDHRHQVVEIRPLLANESNQVIKNKAEQLKNL